MAEQTASESLSPAERADLARLESAIDKGRPAFREVALALWEIRDRLLFRENFATFEDYCRERLNISKWTGGALATAGWVVNLCEAEGLAAPETLRQARNARRVLGTSRPRGRPSEKAASPAAATARPDRVAKLREILAAPSPSARADGYEKLHQVVEPARPAAADKERKVKEHVQILRGIVDLHPCAEKGKQLLDSYEATVLPWREVA